MKERNKTEAVKLLQKKEGTFGNTKEISCSELVTANERKAKRATELVIANIEKTKRAAELVVANAEKAKRAADFVIANIEKTKRADEIINADKELTYQNEEQAKLAAELVIADVNKTKLEAKLVIAKIGNAKLTTKLFIANKELSFKTEEKSELARELLIAEAEKAKRAAKLVIANVEKAKRSAELVITNVEKAKRSAELVIANKELFYRKNEKAKRAAELIIANLEKTKRAAELVIANIEKAKRAAEFVFMNKELALAKEKEKLAVELTILNKELKLQIKEREQAEESLLIAKAKAEENEGKFRNLFENSPIGISITGIDGSLHLNKSFCEIIGYSEEELRDKTLSDITHPEDVQLTNRIKQSLLIGDAEKAVFEKRYIHKNGNLVWVNVSTYLQKDKERKSQFFVTTIIDITERKKYENELIKAKDKAEESNRLKSAFLANMSHEIRTPMNGILGFSDLLKEPGLSSEKQSEYIRIIEKSGARMLNILSEIMDISKIESGSMEISLQETNINEKLKDAYKLLKPEADRKKIILSFKSNLSYENAITLTDRDKLDSILTNLVKNAIKYTDKGSIVFGCELKDETFEFYIKDTGIGILKDRQEAIFERFIQADIIDVEARQGAGLGLSISKALVEMLGGRIWVESEEGKGSVFYFTLPYQTKPSKYVLDESYSSNPDASITNIPTVPNLKILIAEDDENSSMFLSILTKDFSRELLQTTNGFEAVEICRNNPDIDLILMDITMPDMSGYEATRLIRQFNQEVIIIAQTAYGLFGDREKSIQAGCNDYISKPIKSEDLKALIMKYFNK